MIDNLNNFDSNLAKFERILNKIDLIPIANIASGHTRSLLGTVEIAAGLGLATFRHISAGLTNDQAAKKYLYKQAEVDITYTMNGVANLFRGKYVTMRSYFFLVSILETVALFLYDRSGYRFNYAFENLTNVQKPLLRSFNQ